MNNNLPLYRYGKLFNTHDALKIVGLLLMFIDHIGWYLLNDYPPFRLIGRAAAPIFFFLIGYQGKVHVTPFLVVYGIILSMTGGWLTHHFWINILINFIVINYLLSIFPIEKLHWVVRVIAFAALVVLTPVIYPYIEYGALGILIAYSAASLSKKEPYAPYWLAISICVYGIYQAIAFGYFFKSVYLISLISLCLGLYYLLLFYQPRFLNIQPPFLIPGLIISRYSLHFYFYHVILLQLYLVLTSHKAFYLIGL